MRALIRVLPLNDLGKFSPLLWTSVFFMYKMRGIRPKHLKGCFASSLGNLPLSSIWLIAAPSTSGLLLFEKIWDLGMDSMTSWLLKEVL